MNLILMSLLVLCVQSEGEKPDLRGPAFGRSLLRLADQDGDGIPELLIADCTTDLPGSKGDDLFVYSLGVRKHIRIIDHGLKVADGRHVLDRLSQGPNEGADFVYFGTDYDWDEGWIGYVVGASSRSGEEVSRIHHDGPIADPADSRVFVLGDVDGEPGDEVLLINHSGGFPGTRKGWAFDGSVYSLAKGKRIRHFGGHAIEPVGDLDQDGVRDYVLMTSRGCAVHSGKTGLALVELSLHGTGNEHAESIEHHPGGDLNEDGIQDLVRVVTFNKEENISRGLWAISGADGKSLWSRTGLRASGESTAPVISMPDENDDGVQELVVLCTQAEGKWGGTPGWGMFCGKSGESLGHYRWGSYSMKWDYEDAPRYVLELLGDIDGDGQTDFAVSNTHGNGALQCHRGWVKIYSRKEGLIVNLTRFDFGPTPEPEASPVSDD